MWKKIGDREQAWATLIILILCALLYIREVFIVAEIVLMKIMPK